MAYENIEVTEPNFCIGPQAGTYCSVDTSGAEAYMRVKNNTGNVITSYTFYPSDTLELNGAVKALKYVGPINQASFYSGLTFYTLENLSTSCIIRKWLLNQTLQRLELYSTIIKNEDANYSYDCDAMAVQTLRTTFAGSAAIGSSTITMTTTSGIQKYDIVMLGPSTDMDNVGATEYAYIHSVVGNDVELRTIEGYVPPYYDYVNGDSIIVFKDIFVFSNPKIDSNQGSIVRLDSYNYGAVVESHESGIYKGIKAAEWNDMYGAVTFVHVNSMLSVEVDNYQVIRSQTLFNDNRLSGVSQVLYEVYEIVFYGNSIYRLQMGTLKRNDLTEDAVVAYDWTTYNYQEDTLLPYFYSIAVYVDNGIIVQQQAREIVVVVRDQFGSVLSNKNIWFAHVGDTGGFLDDSQVLTDSEGVAITNYNSGDSYTGTVVITVYSDGCSQTSTGSQYVYCKINLESLADFEVSNALVWHNTDLDIEAPVVSIRYAEELVPPYGDGWSPVFWTGGHVTIGTVYDRYLEFSGNVIKSLYQPYLHSSVSSVCEDESFPCAFIVITGSPYMTHMQFGAGGWSVVMDNSCEFPVITNGPFEGSHYIDQVLISRHYDDENNVDRVTLNQFVFIANAIPVFWSEKNSINTDIWIKLNPFAADLDTTTFVFKIREVSYAGDTGWVDITSQGTISTFDAGGGLLGMEFLRPMPSEGHYFHHNAIVYVKLEVYDKAPVPNKLTIEYWFRVIQDYMKPYIVNESPSREEYDVSIDTNISFDILDTGAGVDINTLELFIDQRHKTTFTYTPITDGYHIVYDPPNDFIYGSTVFVAVRVDDKAGADNTVYDGWRFHCVDSVPPWFDREHYEPGICKTGVSRYNRDIALQVYGVGDGVSKESIEVHVDGIRRDMLITSVVYRED